MTEVLEADLASFSLPDMADPNPAGWGPGELTDNLRAIPFAPFAKGDRIGFMSDWNHVPHFKQRGRQQAQFGAGAGQFGFKQETDESSFSLVDNQPKAKKFGRRQYQPPTRRQVAYNNSRRRGGRGRGRGRGGYNNGNRKWGGYNNYQQAPEHKEPSVEISESWGEPVETVKFAELAKIKMPTPSAENLVECGALEQFNIAFDRVVPKNAVPLQRFENCQHFTATTSGDPVLEHLKKEKAGNVYATDTILALLMASTKSVEGWDLIIKKKDGEIYIDKRPHSKIDFLTVNENWNEIDATVDKNSVNHPIQLQREATLINHNFSQQILNKTNPVKFAKPNPFLSALDSGNQPASVAYHYRKFTFDDTDGDPIKLVARCAINGYNVAGNGKNVSMTVRALNQFDSKYSGNVEWHQVLEAQPGSVMGIEMKNNMCKLARWTAECMLAGSEEFRLGFVSRVNPSNSFSHEVLLTQRYAPAVFAAQIGVKTQNQWAVLRHLLTMFKNQEDGTYLLIKDPNKPQMHLFNTQSDDFANEGAR